MDGLVVLSSRCSLIVAHVGFTNPYAFFGLAAFGFTTFLGLATALGLAAGLGAAAGRVEQGEDRQLGPCHRSVGTGGGASHGQRSSAMRITQRDVLTLGLLHASRLDLGCSGCLGDGLGSCSMERGVARRVNPKWPWKSRV